MWAPGQVHYPAKKKIALANVLHPEKLHPTPSVAFRRLPWPSLTFARLLSPSVQVFHPEKVQVQAMSCEGTDVHKCGHETAAMAKVRARRAAAPVVPSAGDAREHPRASVDPSHVAHCARASHVLPTACLACAALTSAHCTRCVDPPRAGLRRSASSR